MINSPSPALPLAALQTQTCDRPSAPSSQSPLLSPVAILTLNHLIFELPALSDELGILIWQNQWFSAMWQRLQSLLPTSPQKQITIDSYGQATCELPFEALK